MVRTFDYLRLTPSQTAGPFVHIGALPAMAGLDPVPFPALGQALYEPEAEGERIVVTGSVIDGGGMAIRDALVEIWQADGGGRYPRQEGADPAFHGFGRAATDFATGDFRFQTIRPGPIRLADGRVQPAHITFWIVARGINTGLHTRMYFPEDEIFADPLLARIEHRDRIATLVAAQAAEGYRFDIRLQGPDETVFFDI